MLLHNFFFTITVAVCSASAQCVKDARAWLLYGMFASLCVISQSEHHNYNTYDDDPAESSQTNASLAPFAAAPLAEFLLVVTLSVLVLGAARHDKNKDRQARRRRFLESATTGGLAVTTLPVPSRASLWIEESKHLKVYLRHTDSLPSGASAVQPLSCSIWLL